MQSYWWQKMSTSIVQGGYRVTSRSTRSATTTEITRSTTRGAPKWNTSPREKASRLSPPRLASGFSFLYKTQLFHFNFYIPPIQSSEFV